MPLQVPDPPSGVHDKVRTTLHEFSDNSRFSTDKLRGARTEELDVSTPHQVFTVGLDDIMADRGLDSAKQVGWRYLVEAAGEPIASAETTESEDGVQVMSQFTEGPFVESTAAAVRNAHRLPQLEKAGFELRLLRIPAIYLMALWLHSKSTDLLIPLAPSPIGKEGQIVPVAQLFSELSRQARATARSDRDHTEEHGPSVP
jgi:hypothetical protein